MSRSWRDWQRERARSAVDDYLADRAIRVFDSSGSEIGVRVEINCERCLHWSTVVVPRGRNPAFRCSKCGALTRGAEALCA